MEVQVREVITHEIQITLHADIWNEMTGIVTKSKGVTEIIAFNVIKRVGSTYKKQLCYVPYISDAREMAIVDTLKAIGIPDYINIKAYRDDRSGCYAEYTKCDNSIQYEQAIVKLYK